MSNDDVATAHVPRKQHVKLAASYAGKGLLVIIPALATSYFTYKQTKVQADVEIAKTQVEIAKTKGGASAGYETLVDAIDKIGKDIARLEGRLGATEARLNMTSSVAPAARRPGGGVGGARPIITHAPEPMPSHRAAPVAPAHPPEPMSLPPPPPPPPPAPDIELTPTLKLPRSLKDAATLKQKAF